jgi:hypothetical protein
MPCKLDGGSTGQGLAIASLVAAISCAAAGEARASLPRTEATAALSTRVAALAARINHGDPTLARVLAPEQKIAQWRN